VRRRLARDRESVDDGLRGTIREPGARRGRPGGPASTRRRVDKPDTGGQHQGSDEEHAEGGRSPTSRVPPHRVGHHAPRVRQGAVRWLVRVGRPDRGSARPAGGLGRRRIPPTRIRTAVGHYAGRWAAGSRPRSAGGVPLAGPPVRIPVPDVLHDGPVTESQVCGQPHRGGLEHGDVATSHGTIRGDPLGHRAAVPAPASRLDHGDVVDPDDATRPDAESCGDRHPVRVAHVHARLRPSSSHGPM